MLELRRYLRRLGPYPSLFLLAVPLALVELLKLAAVFVFGSGHWITGAVVMIFAYAASLLVVERLFRIVKPKLMKLPWFAALWKWVTRRWAWIFNRSRANAKHGQRALRRFLNQGASVNGP